MKNLLFMTAGAFLALFVITSVAILMIHVMWLFMIFFVLGMAALYLHLRSEGITWGRASYKARLFIYRHL